MTRSLTRKPFYKDVNEVFKFYDRTRREIDNINATATRLLYKVYSIKPDDWVHLSSFKKERFLYYDLIEKFFYSNLDYFNDEQQSKIKKQIKPKMDALMYTLDDAAKNEDLKFKTYFDPGKKYISSEVDNYYKEFIETFKFYLPFDTPPSRSEFRQKNLRVYDYIQNAKDEIQSDRFGDNKFNAYVNSNELNSYSRVLLEYIIEQQFKIKINYELIAEALSYRKGYRLSYGISEDIETLPEEPIKENYNDMRDYKDDVEFYKDTELYIKYGNLLKSKDSLIIDNSDEDSQANN